MQPLIPRPCTSATWDQLYGDEHGRYCSICGRTVFALAGLSASEIEDLQARNGGRLCGYLAGESAAPSLSRRAVLLGTLLTAISPLCAQTGLLRIRALDATGARLITATVSRLNSEGKEVETKLSNELGETVWPNLAMGETKFQLTAQGFASVVAIATIVGPKEQHLVVTMQVAPTLGEVVTVAAAR